MRWCAEHGLPHSVLLAWDPVDRAKLTAHLIEEAGRCQMCGTATWEWEADPFAYEPMAETCRGCQLKEAAQDESGTGGRGQRVVLVPKAVAARRRAAPRRAPTLGH